MPNDLVVNIVGNAANFEAATRVAMKSLGSMMSEVKRMQAEVERANESASKIASATRFTAGISGIKLAWDTLSGGFRDAKAHAESMVDVLEKSKASGGFVPEADIANMRVATAQLSEMEHAIRDIETQATAAAAALAGMVVSAANVAKSSGAGQSTGGFLADFKKRLEGELVMAHAWFSGIDVNQAAVDVAQSDAAREAANSPAARARKSRMMQVQEQVRTKARIEQDLAQWDFAGFQSRVDAMARGLNVLPLLDQRRVMPQASPVSGAGAALFRGSQGEFSALRNFENSGRQKNEIDQQQLKALRDAVRGIDEMSRKIDQLKDAETIVSIS